MQTAIAWGFGAAIAITVIPLTESSEEISTVLSGIYNKVTGRKPVQAVDPNEKMIEKSVEAGKEVEEAVVVPETTAEEEERVEA